MNRISTILNGGISRRRYFCLRRCRPCANQKHMCSPNTCRDFKSQLCLWFDSWVRGDGEPTREGFSTQEVLFESIFFTCEKLLSQKDRKRDDSYAEEVIFRWKMFTGFNVTHHMWPFYLLQKQEFVSFVVTIMLSHAVISVINCGKSTNVPILLRVYIRRKSLHDETKHSWLITGSVCKLRAIKPKRVFFSFFAVLF